MAARVWPVDAVSGAPSYTGRALRQGTVSPHVGQATGSRPLGGLSGVRPGTPTTIATASSTTWTVTPFLGMIDGEAAAIAGVYAYSFDSNQTGSVTAAAGSARIDRLDVQVDDPAESDGSSVPAVRVVYTAGSPGSGVPAAAPSRSHPLALINVPTSGSPSVTWNASYYAAPGGFVPFNTLAGLQAWTTAAQGQLADVLADSAAGNNGQYRYNGTAWLAQRGARHRLEFAASGAFADGVLRYPQWTLDSSRTWDAPGSTVVAWNNGSATASGLTFNTVGEYMIQATAVLSVNITSGTTVWQASTGSSFEAGGTSGAGNQNLSFTIANYLVTSAGQQLTILFLKTTADPTGINTFRVRVTKVS